MDILEITPDIGVPYTPADKYIDLRERASAACGTATTLADFGLDFTVTDADKETASTLVKCYAEDSEAISKEVTSPRAATMTPASLLLVSHIIDEFGHQVVESSLKIRNLIVNKLTIETDHADARIRLRALELLGKVSDVGMFTDKSEVVVTHQTSGELRSLLKQKLHRMIDPTEIIEDGELVD